MAEIVVRAQCKTVQRNFVEGAVDFTFPVWGVLSPVAAAIAAFFTVARLVSAETVIEGFAFAVLCITYSLTCLLLKKAVANDYFVIDKQGFKLPFLAGGGKSLRRFTPWASVTHVSATVANDKITSSKLFIARQKGSTITLSLNNFESSFIEQFILSAKMWAGDRCDSSVDELQSRLRASLSAAPLVGSASFTEIWEDELGRRFNPTSYIPLAAGKVLRNNTLRIVRQLATGGLSALYLCQQNDRELVVLKESVIPEHIEPELKVKATELFEREAKLLIQLDHPNVVKVLDTFVEAERNYLLLEYANGADLRLLVKQNGPQSESDVLDWAIQIANTLRYLHEREIPLIHRDLTPDNIVLRNDGQIVIVDFGAANEFIGNATGTFVGKHAYIAPEQLRGKATVQSDIYAFGGTLYFLLTGEEPEALSSSRPKDKVGAISEELSEFVESCTQLETSERYKSVAQLLPVLKRLAAQSLVV